MSYKYILNPKYESLEQLLLNIKEIFNASHESIHKARNELKIVEINGIKYVVKSFKVPHLINRLAYTYLREGKAKKSYLNAVKLLEKSVNTPEPVGVIEFFKGGFLTQSFFVSLYEPYDFTIREVFHHKVENYQNILKEFAKFTFEIHQKGVWHIDYSLGNILITKTTTGYRFSLVDINRMEFKKISAEKGLLNFNKFWAKKEDIELLVKEYATLANLDYKHALDIVQKSIQNVERKKEMKNYVKGKK